MEVLPLLLLLRVKQRESALVSPRWLLIWFSLLLLLPLFGANQLTVRRRSSSQTRNHRTTNKRFAHTTAGDQASNLDQTEQNRREGTRLVPGQRAREAHEWCEAQ